jgi:hypothetical protein
VGPRHPSDPAPLTSGVLLRGVEPGRMEPGHTRADSATAESRHRHLSQLRRPGVLLRRQVKWLKRYGRPVNLHRVLWPRSVGGTFEAVPADREGGAGRDDQLGGSWPQ